MAKTCLPNYSAHPASCHPGCKALALLIPLALNTLTPGNRIGFDHQWPEEQIEKDLGQSPFPSPSESPFESLFLVLPLACPPSALLITGSKMNEIFLLCLLMRRVLFAGGGL